MKKILVLNSVFFRINETFIYRQVLALTKQFDIKLLANSFENETTIFADISRKFQLPNTRQVFDRVLSSLWRRIFSTRLPYGILGTIYINSLFRKEKFSLIHAHFGWRGVQILSIAKRHNIPLLVSFHGKDASASLRSNFYRQQLPGLFDYARGIILCSPHMIQSLSLEPWKDKVHVIPYGIDIEEFKPLPAKPERTTLRILHAGRLVEKKGVPDLIRVFSKIKMHAENIELHIIGEGRDLETCKSVASAGGAAASIIFHGAQPVSRVRELMQESDIFVLNSRRDSQGDMEGLPNALLEAMSCGLPVVSTNHAGIPMALVHDYTGLLIPEKDNQALHDALLRLIPDPILRVKLGERARNKIVNEFSLPKMELSLTLLCNASLKR